MTLPAGSVVPYAVTEWVWSTTVGYRFTDFSLKQKLHKVKANKRYFHAELKRPPTQKQLDRLWQLFLQHGLCEELRMSQSMQLVHALWGCVRAHSQYVAFVLVFALQALVYKSNLTLFLPLSVLYASWRFPRAPTWYWNLLLFFTFAAVSYVVIRGANKMLF